MNMLRLTFFPSFLSIVAFLSGCAGSSEKPRDQCPLSTWADAPAPRMQVMSGLDGELLLTALTAEQQQQFCEAAHTALNAVPTETLCGGITSLAPDEATCSDVYGRCLAARPTFACGTSFPAPSDERVAEHCPGITVSEAEHAVSTMFGWILGFDGSYCAVPDGERAGCGEFPADMPETDRDALNCYYNTALLPIRQPSPT